eukprot:3790612-Prymnesium_polylepis.1
MNHAVERTHPDAELHSHDGGTHAISRRRQRRHRRGRALARRLLCDVLNSPHGLHNRLVLLLRSLCLSVSRCRLQRDDLVAQSLELGSFRPTALCVRVLLLLQGAPALGTKLEPLLTKAGLGRLAALLSRHSPRRSNGRLLLPVGLLPGGLDGGGD